MRPEGPAATVMGGKEGAPVNMHSHDLAVGLPDLSMVGAPVHASVAHATFTPYDFRVMLSLLTVPHGQPSGSLADIARAAVDAGVSHLRAASNLLAASRGGPADSW
jgi:hypothetical protein